jgi:putative ABC transport system permease protein
MKSGINYLKMSFRNLGRHKAKTIITVLAISIGISAYLFIDAWLIGMNLESRRNLVSFETGAAKIYSKAYLENKDDMPLYESFDNYMVLIDKLKQKGYDAVPHTVFNGSLISTDDEYPFKFIGIDVENESKVLKYGNYLEKDGSRFIEKNKFEIILGIKGATDLNVGVPKIMDKDQFDQDICSKIENENDKYFILNCYDKLDIPESIDSIVFKKDIINKLSDKNDIRYLKRYYKRHNSYYTLQNNINTGDINNIFNLLNSINFDFTKKYKLKNNLNENYKNRMWSIMTDIGRNSVRLSTVIDKRDDKGEVKHITQLLELKVVGVVNSPDPLTNDYIGYLPLDILQGDLGLLQDGRITELLIRKANAPYDRLPADFESPEIITKNLGNVLPANLVVVDWKEDAKDYLAVSNGDNIPDRILILFFLFIAIIGIANTMLMSVLERTKEIGMLRALGMDDSKIVRLFITEAGMIGFIGAFIGVIIGIIINIWMVNYGIDYSGLLEKTNITNFGYRMVGIYKSAWNFSSMFFCLVLGTLVSAIMAYLPSLRAVKISIVEALRFE